MLTADAKEFFLSVINLAEELDLNPSRIYQMGPVIHENHAPKLHLLTNGKLQYVPEFYKEYNKNPDKYRDDPKRLKRLVKKYLEPKSVAA